MWENGPTHHQQLGIKFSLEIGFSIQMLLYGNKSQPSDDTWNNLSFSYTFFFFRLSEEPLPSHAQNVCGSRSNGLWITPIIGVPLTATHTIVVTYCSRFSVRQACNYRYQ